MLRAADRGRGPALPDAMQQCIGFEICAHVRLIVPKES
jgi:hypothetical protein